VSMNQEMGLIERIGRISSMGIMWGVIGINVGHELGHRATRMQQFMGELLLLSSLETHFLPYHNSGHHAHAGTFEDPATARLNESIYSFILRSHVGSYLHAGKFEALRMHILNKSTFNFRNKMVRYSLVQLLLLITVYLLFGLLPLVCFLGRL
jgi:alkane 1-monooxygenase